jgi:hypothetical protein
MVTGTRFSHHLAIKDLIPPSRVMKVEGAMQLTLKANQMTNGVPGVLRLRGEGTDSIGRFVVDGQARDTGVVKFRKQYIGRHGWWYTGWMLPWGIAGRWDNGLFWIWKSKEGVQHHGAPSV